MEDIIQPEQPQAPLIITGGEDPKPKPTLSKLNTVIQKNSAPQDFKAEVAPVVGFGPAITGTSMSEEQLQAERKASAREVDDEMKANEELIKTIMQEVFGANGELSDQYATTNPSGNKVAGSKLIAKIAEVNDKYGGGGATLNVLTTKAIQEWQSHNDINAIRKNTEAKMPTVGEAQKAFKERVFALESKRQGIVKAAVKSENTLLGNKFSKLTAEREEKLQALKDGAELMIDFKRQELIGAKDAEKLDEILRFEKSLQDGIRSGVINHEQAQKMLGDFTSGKEKAFNDFKSKQVHYAIQPWVKENLSGQLDEEFNGIVNEYKELFRNESLKSKSRVVRIAKEQESLLKKEYDTTRASFTEEQKNRYEQTFQQEAKAYFEQKDWNYKLNTLVAAGASMPYPTGAGSKLAVDSFLSVFGNMFQSAARFVSSLGADNALTRGVTELGFSLQQEHDRYKPNFTSWDTVKNPSLMLQSFGGMVATSIPTVAGTLLSGGNVFAGALIGSSLNAASMAGDVMDRKLALGHSAGEAIAGGKSFFLKDLGINFVNDLVFGHFFKAALKGEAGWRGVLKSVTSEYVQEGVENIESEIAVDQSKTYRELIGSREIQSASIEAAVNTALMLGVGRGFGMLTKRVAAPDVQHRAAAITKNGEAYARAMNLHDFQGGHITQEEYDAEEKDITKLVTDMEEAKQAGLNDDEAQLFVSVITTAQRARTQAAGITNPALKKSLLTKAETLEQKADDLAQGKIKTARIMFSDDAYLVEEEGLATEMNEQLQADKPADWADPFTEQPKIIVPNPELLAAPPSGQTTLTPNPEVYAEMVKNNPQYATPATTESAPAADHTQEVTQLQQNNPQDTSTSGTDVEALRKSLPAEQAMVNGEATQKILDYAAEVHGVPKINVKDGKYISWLQSLGDIGDRVANALNFPKAALELLITEANNRAALDAKKKSTEVSQLQQNIKDAEVILQKNPDEPVIKQAHAEMTARLQEIAEPFTETNTQENESTPPVTQQQSETSGEPNAAPAETVTQEEQKETESAPAPVAETGKPIEGTDNREVRVFNKKGKSQEVTYRGFHIAVKYDAKTKKYSLAMHSTPIEENEHGHSGAIENRGDRGKFTDLEHAMTAIRETIDSLLTSHQFTTGENTDSAAELATKRANGEIVGPDSPVAVTRAPAPTAATTATTTEPASKPAKPLTESQELKDAKKAYNDKMWNEDNKTSDVKVYGNLSPEKKKIKLDAMVNRTQKALRDGLISWEDYDTHVNWFNDKYQALGDPHRVSRPTIQATEQTQEVAPAVASEMDTTDGKPATVKSKPKSKEAAKKVADTVRKAKIKAKGIQSNLLGVPIFMYNQALEIVAKAVEAGGSLHDGIKAGVAMIVEQVKGIDTEAKIKNVSKMITHQLIAQGILTDHGSVAISLSRRARQDEAVAKLRKFKTTSATVNLAGGIEGEIYNEGIDAAINKLTEGGTSADAVEAMTQLIKEKTGISDEAVRRDVRRGFNKSGIVISSPKQTGGTVAMSMRDLFLHSMHAKKSIATVIEEIQMEVGKYFAAQGMTLDKGRVGAAMKALASLATVDPDIEAIDGVLEELDSIMIQQQHADDVVKANDLIKKFKQQLRRSTLLTETYINRLRNINLPTASNVLMVDGSLTDYIDTLQQLLKAFGNKQGARSVSLANIDALSDRMTQLEKIVADYKQTRLEDRFLAMQKKDPSLAGMTVEEYLGSVQAENELEENRSDEEKKADRKKKKDEEWKAYKESVAQLQKSLQHMLNDGHSFDTAEADVAAQLSVLNIETLSRNELYQFNDILNNLLLDGETIAAGQFLNKTEAKFKTLEGLEGSGIEIRGLGKLFGTIDTANMHNLTNLLEGVTLNKVHAAKLRHLVIGQFEQGIKTVQNILNGNVNKPGVIPRFLDLIEKNKITIHDQYQIGVFAFLNQFDRTDPQHFQQMYDKVVKDNIEALSKAGAEATRRSIRKPKIQAAKRTADAAVALGLINGYEITKKGVITVDTKDGFSPSDLKLNDQQKELYNFVRSEFDAISYDLKKAAGLWYGMDMKLSDNYFPMIAQFLETSDIVNDSTEVSTAMDIVGDPADRPSVAPVDRIKKRSNLAGKDKYYDMGFVDVFLNSYYQALVTIHAGDGLTKSGNVVNSKRFAGFIAGKSNTEVDGLKKVSQDNIADFRGKIADIFLDMRYPPFRYPGYRSWFDTIFSNVNEFVIKTILSRSDQIVNQYAPNYVATMIECGAEATMAATEVQAHATGHQAGIMAHKASKGMTGFDSSDFADDYESFLGNFFGQFRSARGIAATEEHIQTVHQNTFFRNASRIHGYLNVVGSTALNVADKGVFHISLISAYIQHQVKTGKLASANDFSLEAAVANPDQESIAYAEQIAARINNESNRAYRANVVKMKGNMKYLNMYLLGGYGLNSFMGAFNSGRTLFSPQATTEDKQMAARNLSGYVSQIVSFNMLKIFITPIAYKYMAEMILDTVFNTDLPEPTEEQKANMESKKWSKVWMASVSDILFSGANSLIRGGGDAGLNALYELHAEAKRKEMGQAGQSSKGTAYDRFFKPIFEADDNYGAALNMGMKAVSIVKDFATENKVKGLSTEQRKAMDQMDALAFVALFAKNGDLYKTANSGRSAIMSTKGGGGSATKSKFNMKFGGSNKFGLHFK